MALDKLVDSTQLNADLTSVANAIRAKGGTSGQLAFPAGFVSAISGIEDALPIPPDYVIDEAQRLVTQVLSHPGADDFETDYFRFMVCSDVHVANANAQLMESALHMAQGMAIVARYLRWYGLDFVAHLGDLTTGAATTTIADGKKDIGYVNSKIKDAFTYLGTPQLRTVGNHDCLGQAYANNGNQMLTPAELFELFGSYNTGAVYGSEVNCNYCYLDTGKIRVILLDTSQQTPSNLHPSSVCMNTAQYQFFADALAGVGSKSDANQWSIIVMSHMPPDWPDHNGFRYLSLILKDYLDGASGSYGGASYNFSGKNTARFIGWFHGHVHCYKTDKIHYVSGGSTLEMKAYKICIPNACFNRNNEYGSTPKWNVVYGEETTYPKTANSGQDTAFCVISVDLANGKIYADHYGAGYDREVSYLANTYPVTIGSTGKATVNAPAAAVEGEAFTATVTVPSSSYIIDSVTVTMGGTVVSGAYSEGTIYIANVTGAIEISVVTSGYTNIIDTIGYTDGYRISTSSGAPSAKDGYTLTGFIDLTPYRGVGCVIRTSGVDFRASAHSNATFGFYKPDETKAAAGYLSTVNFSDAGQYGLAEWDENGNMTLTLSATAYPIHDNTRPLLRIAGWGSGANLIVTINEPIP